MAVAAGRVLPIVRRPRSGVDLLFGPLPLERKELGGAIRDPAKTLGDVLSADRVAQIAREHPELSADTPVRDAVSVLSGTGATADERQFYFDKDAPFRHLTGQQRRKLVNVIDDRLNKGMGEMRVQTQNDFKNHIDSLKSGGEGKDINWRTYEGMFSVRQVAQMKLMDEQARIQGTFATGLKDAATMPEAELRQRIEAMAPTEDDKHAAFKTGLQKKAQVQFVKLMNERRVDPAKAVASEEKVQQAQEEATALSASQSPPQATARNWSRHATRRSDSPGFRRSHRSRSPIRKRPSLANTSSASIPVRDARRCKA